MAVLDTLNLKLSSSKTGSVPIPFSLLPKNSNNVVLRFSVQQVNVPQSLKATLTYSLEVFFFFELKKIH